MVTLFDVNEQNWLDVVSLSVTEEQQKFLAAPMEIVARGYIYRACNAYATANMSLGSRL